MSQQILEHIVASCDKLGAKIDRLIDANSDIRASIAETTARIDAICDGDGKRDIRIDKLEDWVRWASRIAICAALCGGAFTVNGCQNNHAQISAPEQELP